MPESKREVRRETAEFHDLIENGSLEQLKRALANGADVNAPGHVDQTALMVAIANMDLEKMRLLIDHGADPELTDQFNGTALRHAVSWDFADGVQFLLNLGVDKGYHPKYPLKTVDYDLALPEAAMPEELRAILSEAEWQESMQSTRESIRESG